jgi:hypothetical protein
MKSLKTNKKISPIGPILAAALLAGGLLLALQASRPTAVYAHEVPSPCDFTTGGGWIKIAPNTAESNGSFVGSDQKANFGLVGGCKNGGFYGHVNYVDHNIGLHVSSDSILAYFDPCPGCTTGPSPDGSSPGGTASKARDICGVADTNLYGTVFFHVRTIDAEQQDHPPQKDKFGITLCPYPGGCDTSVPYGSSPYIAPTRCLASDNFTGNGSTCSAVNPGGGDIELHKPNNSNTGPTPPLTELQIIAACGGSGSFAFLGY